MQSGLRSPNLVLVSQNFSSGYFQSALEGHRWNWYWWPSGPFLVCTGTGYPSFLIPWKSFCDSFGLNEIRIIAIRPTFAHIIFQYFKRNRWFLTEVISSISFLINLYQSLQYWLISYWMKKRKRWLKYCLCVRFVFFFWKRTNENKICVAEHRVIQESHTFDC